MWGPKTREEEDLGSADSAVGRASDPLGEDTATPVL